ncbi:MAG: hypothetical protein AB9903_16915 [Vulcanimicrobiota bacterium]
MKYISSGKKFRHKMHSGFALASVLMIVGIVLVISLSAASISIFQLNVAQNISNATLARMAAQSELNHVLFNVIKDSAYGTHSEREVWNDPNSRALAVVNFSISTSGDEPLSINNLNGSDQKPGWNGRTVPANSIHMVAKGTAGNVTKYLEMIVKKAEFNYALIASGEIDSENYPIHITGVSCSGVYQPGQTTGDRPGNIHSNNTGTAIKAPSGTYITGTATAMGSIQIAQPSAVKGGIRSNLDKEVEIPSMSTASFDPKNQNGVVLIDSGSYNGLILNSLHRCDGAISVSGDIAMDNAVLFTEGDITVNGKVTGHGALITKGCITVLKSSNFSSTNKLAIVADGDVTVKGEKREESYFQGLIYTHGNFTGEKFTVLGNVIAQSANTFKGKIILRDVCAVYNEEYSKIQVKTTTTPPREEIVLCKQISAGGVDESDTIHTCKIYNLQKLKETIALAKTDYSKCVELDKYADFSWYNINRTGGGSSLSDGDLPAVSSALKYLDNKPGLWYGQDEHITDWLHNDEFSTWQNHHRFADYGGFHFIHSDRFPGMKWFYNSYQNLEKLKVQYPEHRATYEFEQRNLFYKGLELITELEQALQNSNAAQETPSETHLLDLTLNNYLTKILPTRVTFQGEAP